MKITLEDALSLLSKYTVERTPVLAVFVTPSVSVARVLLCRFPLTLIRSDLSVVLDFKWKEML
jgi:hypothetical protein